MTRKTPAPPPPARRPWLPWVSLGMRVLIGGILAFSGAGKAGAPPEEFAAAIEAYAIVPQGLIMPMATLLPWAEVMAGFALLAGWLTKWAAAAAGGLFCVFIVGLGSTMVRGIELADCGCFGFGFHLAPSQTVFLDVFLAGAACWLFLRGGTAFSLDAWAAGPGGLGTKGGS